MKTLKELPQCYVDADGCVECDATGGEFVYTEELKAEAIKWIKEINYKQYDAKNKNYDCVVEGCDINCGEYVCDNVVDWIKHFFNITEDDLK